MSSASRREEVVVDPVAAREGGGWGEGGQRIIDWKAVAITVAIMLYYM